MVKNLVIYISKRESKGDCYFVIKNNKNSDEISITKPVVIGEVFENNSFRFEFITIIKNTLKKNLSKMNNDYKIIFSDKLNIDCYNRGKLELVFPITKNEIFFIFELVGIAQDWFYKSLF